MVGTVSEIYFLYNSFEYFINAVFRHEQKKITEPQLSILKQEMFI